MIAIIFATEEEALPFLQRYKRGRFEGLVEGDTQHDDDVLISLIGVGKIKATLRTERLLQRIQPKRLFHAGTCTALKEAFALNTVVAAAQVFEGDRIELAAPTYPRMPLEVPFDGLPEGTLVTQDHTVRGQSEQSYWQRIADFSDMTGYAVAYVTATYGIPCHIIKVVTGHFGKETEEFRKTLETSCEDLADFLLPQVDRFVSEK